MFLCCIHEKMIKNYHKPKCQLAKWYVAGVTTCFVSGVLPRYGTLAILPSTNKTVNPLQIDGSRHGSRFFFFHFFGNLSRDSLYIKMETWILSQLKTGDWSPSLAEHRVVYQPSLASRSHMRNTCCAMSVCLLGKVVPCNKNAKN